MICYVLIRETVHFGRYEKSVRLVSLEKEKLISKLETIVDTLKEEGVLPTAQSKIMFEYNEAGRLTCYSIESANFE